SASTHSTTRRSSSSRKTASSARSTNKAKNSNACARFRGTCLSLSQRQNAQAGGLSSSVMQVARQSNSEWATCFSSAGRLVQKKEQRNSKLSLCVRFPFLSKKLVQHSLRKRPEIFCRPISWS